VSELWILDLGKWILGILAGAAATDLITTSEFFFPLRNLMAVRVVLAGRFTLPIWKFLNKLTSCRTCLAFWVSAGLAIDLPGGITGEWISDFLVRTLALHWLIRRVE